MLPILFGALLCWQAVGISAQIKGEQLPVINIQKTSWKVLFQGFVSRPGSQIPTSEIENITGTLAKTLNKLGEHQLDENEKNDLRERAIRRELYKHYKEYNGFVDSRDRAAINATLTIHSRFSQRTAQGGDDKKINDKADLIDRIQNMDRELIAVPDTLPLEFDDQSAQIYEPANITLLNNDYDIFIWGISSGRNNIFQIEMRAYIANANREVTLWKGIVGRSNYSESVEMIRNRVSSLLLGRLWAAMKIDAETSNDSDSKIYVDGKLQGENSLTLYGLYPDHPYELEIIANGLQGKHFFVTLEAGKLNSFKFQLDIEVPEKFIKVASSSPADVYLGVRYLGETPLKIQVPSYDTLLVLVAQDKRTLNYDLKPGQQGDLFFRMEASPKISLKEENDKRRTRFYWSSALFMISLAIPVIATGVGFVNQGLSARNTANSDRLRYQQSMFIGFGVAIGGGLLSGGLLALNIYDFIQYTKSTRALATTEFEPRKVSPEEASTAPNNTSTVTKTASSAASSAAASGNN